MTDLCECVVKIFTYLPISCVKIIQEYVHNRIWESFYRKSYDNFKFSIRLNKKLNAIQESDTGCDLNKIPKLRAANPFYLNIFGMRDIGGNPCRWLEIDFLVDKRKYFFSTCLTSFVKCSSNKLITRDKHSCRTFHKKLVKYFSEGNKNVLLAEIVQQCRVAPIKEDYEKIWSFIHERVTAKILIMNLWQEIHN